MRFREHRGGLAEAMDTAVNLSGREALVAHCAALLRPYDIQVDDSMVKVGVYNPGRDPRIGWEKTYVVTVTGYGVIGFCDEDPALA